MNKILKLMPDYDCFPLWIVDTKGLENINPDDLDIPKKLKTALHLWSGLYDQTLNREDPILSRFFNKKYLLAMNNKINLQNKIS